MFDTFYCPTPSKTEPHYVNISPNLHVSLRGLGTPDDPFRRPFDCYLSTNLKRIRNLHKYYPINVLKMYEK